MNTKKQLFYKKSSIVFDIICKQDLEYFARLFIAEDSKTTLKHREIYLRSRWLNEKEPVYPRLFKKEYPKYRFSKLQIDAREIFRDANEFLEMDIERFYNRIEEYKRQEIRRKSDINESDLYYYMYVFNVDAKNNKHIDYYEIEYIDSQILNDIHVYVKPPKHKSIMDIKPYNGIVKYKNNKIIFQFENENDYISAIFNMDLINSHTKYLVGVGVGIVDRNQKIPIAKKVILTKELIEDTSELYLSLNEAEMIYATENSYKFKRHDDKYLTNYFKDFIQKIDRLDTLFQNLLKQNIYNSFYKQLAIREFSAINAIFQKLKNNRAYHTHYCRRIIDVLIKSYTFEQYSHIYMVISISKDDNIFECQSSKAIALQNSLKELSSSVEIEIIFVREKQQPLTHEFKIFLDKINPTIKTYSIFRDEIENEVNSIDFIFTDKFNFVISNFLRTNNSTFNLYIDQSVIEEHESIYKRILNRSQAL